MKTDNPNITARVIADSLNRSGNRLTSLVITLPRIVLAEFNTHRAISRNSASSRAIPFKKMLEQVYKNPFVPTRFQQEHTGMQGTKYYVGDAEEAIQSEWLSARDTAMLQAKALNELGVTKQLCNRLLEPFLYHTIIATATEWENFIALRAHDMAEIHIQDAAYKVLDALNNSTPKMLEPGQWHIPFGDKINTAKFEHLFDYDKQTDQWCWDLMDKERFSTQDLQIKIAVARCARVSYMNFEGKDDYKSDIKLHDMLKESGHMSPFEHVAQVVTGVYESGNFKGFKQYRKTIEGENKKEERIVSYGYGKNN
jgi:thymidylate synthase ThyX